ncbi:MAG: hypothetical protein H6901_03830 [Rhodobacteraceae bacterium]|nr:hypothetical protein [Paracoccaceae bacterium]MCP5341324.1 hypothetical protein [Paracoccaceae bacterium]
MEYIADILLGAGALGAGIYCWVLARRLRAFNQLENGIGGAVAVLSAQVDDMTAALETARATATGSSDALAGMTRRAESAVGKLELLLATLHDLPEPEPRMRGQTRVVRRRAGSGSREGIE